MCFILAQEMEIPLVLGSVRRDHPFLAHYSDVKVQTLIPHVKFPLLRSYAVGAAFRHCAVTREEDAVIYSGSYAPMAVRRKPSRLNVLYCHTPPRFMYDNHKEFSAGLPLAVRPVFKAYCGILRKRYSAAVARMDIVLANSGTVKERIQRIFKRDSIVIPPPCCEFVFEEPHQSASGEGFYLSMSRLDKLKRVDLLVKSFMAMPSRRLVVASSGPEAESLRNLAQGAPNVIFTGMLADNALRNLLRDCIATICVAQNEDFGMCAVESLAAGKPVIVAGAGGLAEIIEHGRTGICLAPDPTEEEIGRAVAEMDAVAASMREACLQRASRFSVSRFIAAMRHVLRYGTKPPEGGAL